MHSTVDSIIYCEEYTCKYFTGGLLHRIPVDGMISDLHITGSTLVIANLTEETIDFYEIK